MEQRSRNASKSADQPATSWMCVGKQGVGKVKVITIDGPAGSGKSTVASIVATFLGWMYVNTGSIYRALALLLHEAGADVDDADVVSRLVKFIAEKYRQESRSGRVFLADREVTLDIRAPFVSEKSSIVAQHHLVRSGLLPVQRRVVLDCNGAVVDGRDMGTVVFPDAPLKIYLTAAVEERAMRRSEEMKARGKEVDMDALIKEIYERDRRDAGRAIAPMRPADDAIIVDSTVMSPQQVAENILKYAYERGLVPKPETLS